MGRDDGKQKSAQLRLTGPAHHRPSRGHRCLDARNVTHQVDEGHLLLVLSLLEVGVHEGRHGRPHRGHRSCPVRHQRGLRTAGTSLSLQPHQPSRDVVRARPGSRVLSAGAGCLRMLHGREPDVLRRFSAEKDLHLTGPFGLDNVGNIRELIEGVVQGGPPVDGASAEDDVSQRVVHALECGSRLRQARRESTSERSPKRSGCRRQSIRSL